MGQFQGRFQVWDGHDLSLPSLLRRAGGCAIYIWLFVKGGVT